jgi:hypothetical protein
MLQRLADVPGAAAEFSAQQFSRRLVGAQTSH